jgi:hypothetical protein
MTGARRLEELGVGNGASTPSTAVGVIPARGALVGANSPTARGDGAVETINERSAEGSAGSSGGAGQETAAPRGPSIAAAPVFQLPALRKASLAELLNAEVVPIGRREVQPGRRDVVLLDALQAKDWVWLRFLVPGGARDHVEGLSWDDRQVGSYQAETLRGDLRLVVRISRQLFRAKSKAILRVGRGEYRFPLRAGTLGGLFGGPFQ